MTMNPEFRTVRSPYDDGGVLLAMPAIELDAALVHVDRADRLGNTQTLGPDPYFDEHYARASTSCYVTCEELVDRLDLSHPEDARLNHVRALFRHRASCTRRSARTRRRTRRATDGT